MVHGVGGQPWVYPPGEPKDLETILSDIALRFSSPREVSVVEIKSFYASIFLGPRQVEARSFLSNKNHLFSIIYALHEVVLHLETSPDAAKIGTSSKDCKGVKNSYFLYERPTSALPKALFVFKPTAEEALTTSPGIPRYGTTKREHLASVVNDDKIFPIPFTARVNLFGESGSVQQVVEGKSAMMLLQELPATSVKTMLQEDSLRRKLVFDIIFGNLDGHEGNLLCSPTSLHSIDHGCICGTIIETPLYIPYIRFLSSTSPLDHELAKFCSALPIDKYKSQMMAFEFEESAITLMEKRATLLMGALSMGLTLQETALPFILIPREICSMPAEGCIAVFEKILTFRNNLETYCREERVEDLKKCLVDLRGGISIEELVRGEDKFKQFWSLYLKPLLTQYHSDRIRELVQIIGGSI